MVVVAVFVCALTAMSGCGGDDVGGDAGDASVPDAMDSGVAVAAPMAPAAPDIPCPEGFREASWGGVAVCDAYAEGGQEVCGDGEAHLPGTAGCAPLGNPCPAGDFADTVPAGAVYVRAGATGGDGTEAAPFGTIAEGLSRGIGTAVAIAKGTYDEQLSLPTRTTLVGACAAETILTTSVETGRGTLSTMGSGVVVRDLAIADSPSWGVVVDGGDLQLEGVAIMRVRGTGLTVVRGADVTATGLLIRDVAEDSGGRLGHGIDIGLTSTLALDRVAIEDVHEAGILVFSADASAAVNRTVVRGVTPARVGPRTGWGVVTQDGSTLELSESVVADTFQQGVYSSLGSTATLRDVIIAGVTGGAAGGGTGIGVFDGASLVGDRVFVRDAASNGAGGRGPGSTLELRDFVIVDTGSQQDGTRGGVYCDEGGRCTLTRGVIARSQMAALFGEDETTVFDVADVTFLDGVADESSGVGRAVYMHYGATANLARVVSERAVDTAFFMHRGGTINAQDVVIRDVATNPVLSRQGRGVQVQVGSHFDLTRAVVEGTNETAILAMGDGTTARLVDVVARDSATPPCVLTGGCVGSPGVLLASVRNARVDATNFTFERGATCGVFVAENGQMSLSAGVIVDNPIGACVQVDGFDVATLTDDVRYVGNETNLQATALPVPETSVGLE